MGVVALVIEDQPVKAAGLDADGIGLGKLLAVDSPVIHPAVACKLRLENQRQPLVRFGGGGGVGKDRVLRDGAARRGPLAGTWPVRVFNYDAEAALTHLVVGLAQNPDSGAVHFYDGVDALGGGEFPARNGG